MIIHTTDPDMIAKMLASGWVKMIHGTKVAYVWTQPIPRA